MTRTGKTIGSLLAISAALAAGHAGNAAEIGAVPGPNDQGGMIMPMVTITGADNLAEPTTGAISIGFNPGSVPVLQTLEEWSPGNWFSSAAAWRPDLGSPDGIGGTPSASAGAGDRFNSQYGWSFSTMSGTRANIPTGKSLGIRLTSLSSTALKSFNYGSSQNRWDPVFPTTGSQVLWNGTMWHNYFTLPAAATPGTYTAEFEVFVANTPFTGATGSAQYDSTAAAATADAAFTPASIIYNWTVSAVPEPTTFALVAVGCLAAIPLLRRRMGRA